MSTATKKLAYYYKNGQYYEITADIENGTFLSFDISNATEETISNIPGYTWNITDAQLAEIADPTTQSVVIEVLIPESAELTHHYIFRRDYAAMAGTTGAAYFFAVDTSSASSTVIGAAMRLRAYKQATQAKLRIENLGEVSATDTGATSVTVTGSGNAVSGASYDASTRKITLTKGVTALTSHQGIKTLKTDNTTAQSTSSSEAIAGSGTINLHKIAKTGTYSDLIGTPTLATVATSGSYNDLSNKPTIPTAVGDLSNDRFVRYDTASQGLSATQKSNARTNIGAGTGNGSVTSVRVRAGTGLVSSQSTAQTGTLDTTISVANDYKLPTLTEWNNVNDLLFAGSIDTDDYELADFIKWVTLQENPIDGAIYTMYDRNHEFCMWKGISLDGGRTVVALRTTLTSGGAESTPDFHLVSIINIDETTGECTFEDAEMASVASVQTVDTKASKVVISGTQYTASFSNGVLSFTA